MRELPLRSISEPQLRATALVLFTVPQSSERRCRTPSCKTVMPLRPVLRDLWERVCHGPYCGLEFWTVELVFFLSLVRCGYVFVPVCVFSHLRARWRTGTGRPPSLCCWPARRWRGSKTTTGCLSLVCSSGSISQFEI